MKKLNIGGATTEAPSKSKSKHPSVKVGGRLEELLRQFVVVNPQFKTLKAQQETLSRDIGGETRPLFFEYFAGVVPESSTMLANVGGRDVKLIVKDRYSQMLTDDKRLRAAIGDEVVDKWFHWRTKYGIDYDKIAEDKQEAFAAGVEELRVKLGIAADAITAKQFVEPNAGFHESRTITLTPEQNKALDALLPVTAYPML
jgi:hypothetical protein